MWGSLENQYVKTSGSNGFVVKFYQVFKEYLFQGLEIEKKTLQFSNCLEAISPWWQTQTRRVQETTAQSHSPTHKKP